MREVAMVLRKVALLALAAALAAPLPAQRPPANAAADEAEDDAAGVIGPFRSDRFRTTYVRLGRQAEGLLYEPTSAGHKAKIALVYSHPNGDVMGAAAGEEMASRGYPILMVNYRGVAQPTDAYLPAISRAFGYLRALPGVTKVVAVGHSGGGHLMPLYVNVALNGAKACNGPEKIYPCRPGLDGLVRPDGLVLLDPTFGALHQASSVDPAQTDGGPRKADVDMFAAANGYDAAAGRGRYPPAFAQRFHAAQAARNATIVDGALTRSAALKAGAGSFSDDEPLVIRGMGVNATGARLYQPDTSYVSRTKRPHLLLRADGTEEQTIIRSVRAPSGRRAAQQLDSLAAMSQNTTVRRFLASSAIRTLPGYAFTADDVVGVDWRSAISSSPSNAEGITVPSLVLTMSCHYLVVPGEIIFDHLAARDKTYAAVEGATHSFGPCRPEYGDTRKRTFDYVDRWLSAAGRF